MGVLTNAICEAKGLELIDYVTEAEKKGKKEEKINLEEVLETEEIPVKDLQKEVETPVEVAKKAPKKEEKSEVDYSTMTLTELKALAKEKELKGYSTLKKDELINKLKEN